MTLVIHDPTNVLPMTWQKQIDSFLLSRTRTPFAWGEQDCCLFAADAVKASTGVDHAKPWRGTYSTEEQAAELLEQLGGLEGLGALVGEEVLPLTAQAGDVGIVFDGAREMLGVCAGPHWMVPGKYGLAVLPLRACRKAWRVPHG
jgi:hypothetical protein